MKHLILGIFLGLLTLGDGAFGDSIPTFSGECSITSGGSGVILGSKSFSLQPNSSTIVIISQSNSSNTVIRHPLFAIHAKYGQTTVEMSYETQIEGRYLSNKTRVDLVGLGTTLAIEQFIYGTGLLKCSGAIK